MEYVMCDIKTRTPYIDGSVRDRSNSIAHTLELLQSCTKAIDIIHAHSPVRTTIFVIILFSG